MNINDAANNFGGAVQKTITPFAAAGGVLFYRFVQVPQTKMDKIGNIDSKICRKRACHCGAKCAIVKIKFSKKEVKFVCGSL